MMSNDEKRKALIDSEIDGLCIRYSLSDAQAVPLKRFASLTS